MIDAQTFFPIRVFIESDEHGKVYLPAFPRVGERLRLSDGLLVRIEALSWLLTEEPSFDGAAVAVVETIPVGVDEEVIA